MIGYRGKMINVKVWNSCVLATLATFYCGTYSGASQ